MLYRTCSFLLFLLLGLHAVVASSQTMQQQVAQLLKNRSASAHTAIWLADMSSGEVLYQHYAQHSLLPASTQKFVTAVAAMLALGSEWRYQTQLIAVGKQHRGVLSGRVVLKFSGDPTLTTEDLTALLQHLRQRGVRKLAGPIQLDFSAFSSEPYQRGMMWEDLTKCYAVPNSAAVLDENCIHFQFTMRKNRRSPEVRVIPAGVVTLSKHIKRQQRSQHNCRLEIVPQSHNHYSLSGCVPNKNLVWTRAVAIWDTQQFIRRQVQKICAQLGIRYQKITILKSTNHINQPLKTWVHYSKPLHTLVADMLKTSDNLIANSLFRTVGLRRYGPRASWVQASQAIREVLAKKLSLQLPEDSMRDGAGLSMYNRFTAAMLGQTLFKVYQQPNLRQQLLPLLAVAGVDGTLKNRFKHSPVRNRFFAKTGTLSGVSALMGFLHTAQNHWLGLVIMTQGDINQKYAYRSWEETLVNAIYHQI